MNPQIEIQFMRELLKAMLAYAELLADTNLALNQKKISEIRFLTEMIASYHSLEGYDLESDILIRKKYLEPLDELLAGKAVQKSEFNERHMLVIKKGLEYYREELEDDYDPVYDKDIELCTEFVTEIETRLLEEECPGWQYNMQL